MESILTKNSKTGKVCKSRLWIVKDIYFYVIGINLFLIAAYRIFSEIVDFKESLVITIALLLISAVGIIFAIKWGVERVLKKTIVHPNEVIKICFPVLIIPIIFVALISAWLIYINLENFSSVAWYLVPWLLSTFIGALISGIFYGIVTYFWFRKLSR